MVISAIALVSGKPHGNCPACGGGASSGGYPSGPAVSTGGGASQINQDYVRFGGSGSGGSTGLSQSSITQSVGGSGK